MILSSHITMIHIAVSLLFEKNDNVYDVRSLTRITLIITIYLHFHCESLNEPLHLKRGLYLHEQIDLSHTHICAI